MSSGFTSLNSGMAMRAKADEVCQVVRFFPVIAKCAPRVDVMNVKRVFDLLFSFTAILTGVVIALSCFILLSLPVWAAPCIMTALPVAMILSLLPFCSAFIRAEIAAIFSAGYDVTTNINDFTALFTSQIHSTVIGFTCSATESNGKSFNPGGIDFKHFSAFFALEGNAILTRFILALRGAIEFVIPVRVAIGNKFNPAIATGISID